MPTIIGLAAVARSGKDTVASMLLEHREVAAYALADPLKLGCQALFGLTDDEAWLDEIKETTIDLWGMSPRQMFQRAGTEWMRHDNPDHWLLRADKQLNHAASPSSPPTPTDLDSPSATIWLAVQAFWGLSYDQTWIAGSRSEKDRFWGRTPQEMFSVLQGYVLRDFPQYSDLRPRRPVQGPTRSLIDSSGKSIFIIKDIRYENEASFWRSHGGVIWHITRNNAKKVNAHSSEDGISLLGVDFHIENNGTLEELRHKVQHAWKSVTSL